MLSLMQHDTKLSYRRMSTTFAAALIIAIAAAVSESQASERSATGGLIVDSVVLRLLEEAEVPAQEAGVVTSVAVREGQRVKQGELLTQIDDEVPRLAAEAVQAQYDIARAKAANDVRRRFAKKSLEVSQAELQRSMESIERFAKSVSQSQLDVERLTVQKNQLESEQADHEHEVATLEMKAQENELTAARAGGPPEDRRAVRRGRRADLRAAWRVGRAGPKSAANHQR